MDNNCVDVDMAAKFFIFSYVCVMTYLYTYIIIYSFSENNNLLLI